MLNRYAKDTAKKFYNLTPEDLNSIYFDNKVITKKNLENLVDFSGDLYFIESIQRAIKTQIDQKCEPTYVYFFTYDKGPSIIKMLCNIQMNGTNFSLRFSLTDTTWVLKHLWKIFIGASHADELAYLFKGNLTDVAIKQSKKNSFNEKFTQRMIEMWVNFATTGWVTTKLTNKCVFIYEDENNVSGFRNPTPQASELLPIIWQPIDEKSGLRCMNIGETLRMEIVRDISQQYAARQYPKHL